MKKFICTVCPKGCRLEAGEENGVFFVCGNGCKRGEAYARAELSAPVRTLTATCPLALGERDLPLTFPRRVPVKSSAPVPLQRLSELATLLRDLSVELPVSEGQILAADFARCGADIIATRTINLAD